MARAMNNACPYATFGLGYPSATHPRLDHLGADGLLPVGGRALFTEDRSEI